MVADALEQRGLQLEYGDRDTFAPVITMADTEETVEFLVTEITDAIDAHRGRPRPLVPITAWTLEAALAPGERINAATLAALQAEARSGTRIAYCGDPMLETVLVVRE